MIASLITTFLAAQAITVNVIDSGAGNCILAEIPGGETQIQAIFDAGCSLNSNQARDAARARIRELMGDDKDIELMVLSHIDYDHIALAGWILDEYNVHTVIYPERTEASTSNTWRATRQKILDEGCAKVTPGMFGSLHGLRQPLGDATYTMMSGYDRPPLSWGISTSDTSPYNNAPSIVIRLAYYGSSILFMGDALGGKGYATDQQIKWAEKYMLDRHSSTLLRSNVIVAGHHGADNASYPEFIRAVRPTFVVFSSGHAHKHPRRGAAERFLAAGVSVQNIFRTDRGDHEGGEEWPVGGGPSGSEDRAGDDEIRIVMPRGGPVAAFYLN